MKLEDFIKKYTGVADTGNTPENKGQCVGLVSVWMDTFNVPHEFGNAKDLLNNADSNYFDVIQNSPTAVPLPGDILVWNIGQFGHTAIFVSGDVNGFTSFDQNWATGQAPTLVSHNYAGVIGWLHPKDAIITQPIPQPVLPVPPDVRSQYVGDEYRIFGISNPSADEINYKVTEMDNGKNFVQVGTEIASDGRSIYMLKADATTATISPNLPPSTPIEPPKTSSAPKSDPLSQLINLIKSLFKTT